MADPQSPEKNHITTVTCRDCGTAYVKADQDGSDYQHFCEMASLKPGAATATSSTASVSDPSAIEVTVKSPSQMGRYDPVESATRKTVDPQDDPNLPEEVRHAAKDPARMVKQYTLVKQIGKGGMGTVWKAWDRNLSRWVAIKFLQGDSQEEIDRFNREAKVAASVRHPNIASIFDVGEGRGQHFIAMEYIDGVSMEQLKVPIKDLVEMMRQVSLAMDTAHKAGIVHRDLKPQNVMVTKQGWPFVLDFGLAKSLSGNQNLSVTGTIMGTPAYMPPEQAQGHTSKIDARSDVYSLGATLYALVAKTVPFKGETAMDTVMKVVKEEPVDPCTHNPECPPEVSTVILKAMEKDPLRRYQTAGEFAEDLRRYLNDESLLAKPPSIRYKIVKKIQKNKLAVALAGTIAAAGVIMIVLLVLLGSKKDSSPAYQQFTDAWEKPGKQVSFADYEADKVDVNAFTDAFRKLAPLPPDQVKKNVDWFVNEARAAEYKLEGWREDRSLWLRNRDEQVRIAAWAKDVGSVLAHLQATAADKFPAFQELPARFSAIGAEAAKMIAYRGRARIRIFPAPYARLVSLTSEQGALVTDGQIVPGPDVKIADSDLTTPVVLSDLDIRDYTLQLDHPELGSHTVRIAADQLRNGGDYVLTGSLSKPGSLALIEAK